MPAKRTKNKQPADDPALKEEVSEAVDEAEQDVSEGDVANKPTSINANLDPDQLHLRDSRSE